MRWGGGGSPHLLVYVFDECGAAREVDRGVVREGGHVSRKQSEL